MKDTVHLESISCSSMSFKWHKGGLLSPFCFSSSDWQNILSHSKQWLSQHLHFVRWSHIEKEGETEKWSSNCSVSVLLLGEMSVNQRLRFWLCMPVIRHQHLSPDLTLEKRDSFYPLYCESIPRAMAILLDCHGNCWEKWFLSVLVCLSLLWRLCCTPLQA